MDDLISRHTAIDALTRKMVSIPTAGEKDLMGDVNRIRTEDISVIRRLPSAQPDLDEVYAHAETEAEARYHAQIVRCKDCKYYQTRQKSGFLPQCCWFDVLTKPNDFCSNGRKENR